MNTSNTSNQGAVQAFLEITRPKPFAISGTLASGATGGSTSNIAWQQPIPTQPSFCQYIDYEITVPVALTLAAGESVTVSPFAPYSAFSQSLSIGGSNPWQLIELLPWALDAVERRINYGIDYPGLGDNTGYYASVLDQGPNAPNIGQAGSLTPGATITNSGTAVVTNDYTITFKVRQWLGMMQKSMWGYVPFGDTANEIVNNLQLNPLVGTNPTQSLFYNSTSTSNTAATNGTTTAIAVYALRTPTLAYPSIPVTNPLIEFGRKLERRNVNTTAPGAQDYQKHTTGMLYTSMHHIALANNVPTELTYFARWVSEVSEGALAEYNAQLNTFNEYFTEYHSKYQRYPYKGQYSFDLTRGTYPPDPTLTPSIDIMTPSQTYATAFDIPVTPAMSTAWQFPTGATSPLQVVMYDFGLVEVPY